MIERSELLKLVLNILDPPAEADDDDLLAMEERFAEEIPHPGGEDLLNYPEHWGLPKNPSPEEIVDAALSWVPRALTMRIASVREHPSEESLRCYEVEIQGLILTQVVSGHEFRENQTVVVALSGCELLEGGKVEHLFVGEAFSAGQILGLTGLPPGEDVSSKYCIS